MDTEQIQQQMRVRRAAIDAKLDLIATGTAVVRRRTLPAVVGMLSALAAGIVWARRRSKQRALQAPHTPRLLTAG